MRARFQFFQYGNTTAKLGNAKAQYRLSGN